jgi:hypothetical protein
MNLAAGGQSRHVWPDLQPSWPKATTQWPPLQSKLGLTQLGEIFEEAEEHRDGQ